MDDLISREQAINRIKKQCEHLHPESDSRDSIGWFAYHICIGILEVQPSAQKTGKWIPVSERLPKDKQVVIITNDKNNVRYGQFRGTGFSNSDCNKWIWKNNTIETVVAWMPLPEPWKGEET